MKKKPKSPLDLLKQQDEKYAWKHPPQVKEWIPVQSSDPSDWKPIELAPKDGSIVVARNAGGFTQLVHWYRKTNAKGEDDGGFWHTFTDNPFTPTTWLCALKK